MSKNTRWALALVGVVIIIVGAVIIGTGKDNTDAAKPATQEVTAATGATQSAAPTSSTGTTGSSGSTKSTGNDTSKSGGAGPNDDNSQSGGAGAGDEGDDASGGAKADISVISPILSDSGKAPNIIANKGDTVLLRGVSESNGEMHLHGYDKEVPLKAGKIARMEFKATIDGEFEVEFHIPGGEVLVGTLKVSP